jgi:hypothetical protein
MTQYSFSALWLIKLYFITMSMICWMNWLAIKFNLCFIILTLYALLTKISRYPMNRVLKKHHRVFTFKTFRALDLNSFENEFVEQLYCMILTSLSTLLAFSNKSREIKTSLKINACCTKTQLWKWKIAKIRYMHFNSV